MILNLSNMKVRCLYNTGEYLRPFENKKLKKDEWGRFGTTGYSEYNELDIGKEYLVMGIIIFESYQAYLIDNIDFISALPCQLFEITNDEICSDWHFRLIGKDENIYPFVQAIMGYDELCSDRNAYENLIVEKDEETRCIYFKQKKMLENKYIK